MCVMLHPLSESGSYLSPGSVTSFHHFPFHLLNPGFLLGVPSHPSHPHQSYLLHRRIHLHLHWRDTWMTSQSGTQNKFQIFTNALNNPTRFPHLHRSQQRQSKTNTRLECWSESSFHFQSYRLNGCSCCIITSHWCDLFSVLSSRCLTGEMVRFTKAPFQMLGYWDDEESAWSISLQIDVLQWYLPIAACFSLTFLLCLWHWTFSPLADPVGSFLSSSGAVQSLFPPACPAETPLFTRDPLQMLFLLTDPVGTFFPSVDKAGSWFPSADPVKTVFSLTVGAVADPGEIALLTDLAEISLPSAITLFWPKTDSRLDFHQCFHKRKHTGVSCFL